MSSLASFLLNIPLFTLGTNYETDKLVNFIYENKPIEREYNKEENISIDLGMDNLMTIYDPNGEQILIKGKKIIQMNEKFNNIIAYQQSNMNKCNHYTSKKIRNIFIK